MTKIAITILLVTHLGIKSGHAIQRDKDGLLIDGAKIPSAFIPIAVGAYQNLQPGKSIANTKRCSEGTYKIQRGTKIEIGCLESERAKSVSAALDHLRRLSAYTQTIK